MTKQSEEKQKKKSKKKKEAPHILNLSNGTM
jgi:hypothetical protein